MNSHYTTAELKKENNGLRAANCDARTLLADAAARLRVILGDKAILEGSALETTTAMEFALEAIDKVLEKLKTVVPEDTRPATRPGGPTR